MGILADFVLASEDELRSALVSWRRVAPQPLRVQRRGVNPFTKEPVEIDVVEWTADPAEPDPVEAIDLDGVSLPDAVVKALARFPDPNGKILMANKISVLERRRLSRLPQVELKSIATVELVSLAAVLCGDQALSEEIERPALLPPTVAAGERWVHKLPERLVGAIAALDDASLNTTAAAWANELEWETADARFVLSQLRGLCMRSVGTTKCVFLHGGL